jgi:predicted adenylyl cyclase CyaB
VRNLEFKARIEAPAAALRRAREAGAELWGDLRQTDTYFAVPRGRLKLRETAGFQAQLVYYERDESAPDRPSDYLTTPVGDGAALREALSRALGVVAVVRKRRTLLLLDTVRVHIDNVEELGPFLEVEVPVRADEAAARREMSSLLAALGFAWDDCVRASYVDLMRERMGGEGDALRG